jgi:16S rRNA (cytidine1402-2'-O)-methyltransferase
MSGKLYIVATPIGNLDDFSRRAEATLRDVACIACEDTRHSRRLMDRFQIATPLLSFHDHNEGSRTAELLERLQRGEDVALISDAGTPLISDPGYRLVREAAAQGVTVVPVPGASSVLAALSASGLPTDRFYFAGFLPPKTNARREALRELQGFDCTLVLLEAPHRIVETLADIEEVLAGRPVVLCRELTKLHEEILRGSCAEVRAELARRTEVKGELTLLLGKAEVVLATAKPEDIPAMVRQRIAEGMPRNEAIKDVAKEIGWNRREVYRLFQEAE